MVAKWQKINFIPMSEEDRLALESIVNVVGGISDAVVASSRAAITALEVAIQVLIALQDPVITGLIAVLSEIRSIFEGILDLGVSMCYIFPNEANHRSLEDCFSLLAGSVQDPLDPDRPITGLGQEAVFMLIFAVRAINFQTLKDLWKQITKLFTNVPEFTNVGEYLNLLNQPIMEVPPGILQGDYPNWQSKRFIDEFPDFRDVVEDIVLEMDNIINLLGFEYAYLEDIIATLNSKINTLEAISERLQSILEFILLLLSGDSSLVYLIAGDYTQSELASEIQGAVGKIPTPGVDNVGAILALSMQAPPQVDNIFTITDTIISGEDVSSEQLEVLFNLEDTVI